MKEDLHYLFQGLDYEERFGPGEVTLTKVRKRKIDTYDIMSVVNQGERKKIFGEDGFLLFFYRYACILQIIWTSYRFSITLQILKVFRLWYLLWRPLLLICPLPQFWALRLLIMHLK